MTSTDEPLGVIGGSGLYELDEISDPEWRTLNTPWGAPSGPLLLGTLGRRRVAFLARHGKGHAIPPSEINYRANICALKMCGVREVVSVSACGSFREECRPGDFVVVDQFFDRTRSRPNTFFGTGCVAHIAFADPVCGRLAKAAGDAAEASGVRVHRGGTYVAIEGPNFSTLAESRFFRETVGCSVVGMTNLPEARLAREAELCYATLALVTDYDCWHPDHGDVDVPAILDVMRNNIERARETIRRLADTPSLGTEPCPRGCERALEYAVITHPESRDPKLVARLGVVASRVLNR